MIVKYGSYSHAANLVSVSISSERITNPRTGLQVLERRTVTMEGLILATSQAAFNTAIDGLLTGYASNGQAWGLYHDDGTTLSSHYLPTANLHGTIRVLSLDFPRGDGPEYATQRTYRVTLQADYKLTGADQVISFTETLSVRGNGGPREVATELALTRPRFDVTAQYTLVTAVQSGSAVGLYYYPPPPPYIFAQTQFTRVIGEQVEVSATGGEVQGFGGIATSVRNYPISWKYTYQSSQGLSGVPNN